MAKASWAVVSPTSGNGNKTVNVSSAAEHSGRTARNTVLTITAANVTPVTVNVNQAGKPQYVMAPETATAVKAGQQVTISGKSNSKKLNFTLGTGDLAVTLPAKYTANSLDTDNNMEIAGDPGASAEYDWSIILTVPANETITDKSKQIIVTDEGGNSDTCILNQAAGDATLSVSKTTVELTYQGTAVSFTVTSNTSWAIS